jgi:Recombinase
VVDIFRRYLRLKSVRALAEELATAGVKSKRRVRPNGTEYGHQRFLHGTLYLLLQNRTYRGEITHKGHTYPGQHAAIVDKQLWEGVQAMIIFSSSNDFMRRSGAGCGAADSRRICLSMAGSSNNLNIGSLKPCHMCHESPFWTFRARVDVDNLESRHMWHRC